MSNAADLQAALSDFPLRGAAEAGGVHDLQRWDEGPWEFESSPGVYLFYDKNAEIIYIGQAKHLGSRTGSYFRRVCQGELVVDTRDPWQIQSISLQMIRAENEGIAAYLEIYLIGKLDAKLNIRK